MKYEVRSFLRLRHVPRHISTQTLRGAHEVWQVYATGNRKSICECHSERSANRIRRLLNREADQKGRSR